MTEDYYIKGEEFCERCGEPDGEDHEEILPTVWLFHLNNGDGPTPVSLCFACCDQWSRWWRKV